jgi:hypothetical protein
MQSIAGIFDNSLEANRAVTELLNAGFADSNISLIMSDEARDRNFHYSSTHHEIEREDNDAKDVAVSGATGAAVGGALGALIAGLTAVGTLAVPGAGLLAAGPIVAALSGAGAGAAVGGLGGALIRAGFGSNEAEQYEEEIRKGKAVVVVHADSDSKALAAKSILMRYHAMVEAA